MMRVIKLVLVTATVLLFAATVGVMVDIAARLMHSDVNPDFDAWMTGLALVLVGALNWRDYAKVLGFVEFARSKEDS